MCYKYLWDSLVADDFPSRQFFEFFSLKPNHILSAGIREHSAKCGFTAEVSSDKNKKFFRIILFVSYFNEIKKEQWYII